MRRKPAFERALGHEPGNPSAILGLTSLQENTQDESARDELLALAQDRERRDWALDTTAPILDRSCQLGRGPRVSSDVLGGLQLGRSSLHVYGQLSAHSTATLHVAHASDPIAPLSTRGVDDHQHALPWHHVDRPGEAAVAGENVDLESELVPAEPRHGELAVGRALNPPQAPSSAGPDGVDDALIEVGVAHSNSNLSGTTAGSRPRGRAAKGIPNRGTPHGARRRSDQQC